jgi:hydrogenase-4 membrane subunit HyfE
MRKHGKFSIHNISPQSQGVIVLSIIVLVLLFVALFMSEAIYERKMQQQNEAALFNAFQGNLEPVSPVYFE